MDFFLPVHHRSVTGYERVLNVFIQCDRFHNVFIPSSYRSTPSSCRLLAAGAAGQSFEHAQNFRRVPPGVNKRQRPINVLPALITNHRVRSPFSTVRRHFRARWHKVGLHGRVWESLYISLICYLLFLVDKLQVSLQCYIVFSRKEGKCNCLSHIEIH